MADEAEIRPSWVEVPDDAIADLRRRIAGARWPSKELVDDRSQGVQLATIQELALVLIPGEQMSSASSASGGAALRPLGSPWAVAAPIFAQGAPIHPDRALGQVPNLRPVALACF
jgi:hypothetical protein